MPGTVVVGYDPQQESAEPRPPRVADGPERRRLDGSPQTPAARLAGGWFGVSIERGGGLALYSFRSQSPGRWVQVHSPIARMAGKNRGDESMKRAAWWTGVLIQGTVLGLGLAVALLKLLEF